MRFVAIKPAPTRWLVRSLLPLTIAFSCTTLVTMPALAQPPPGGEPTPSPAPPAPAAPAPPNDPGGGRPEPALTSLIDPALLESAQRSIVGVVTVWEEPDDLWAMFRPEPEDPAEETEMPIISFCTGWFAGPSSIVTAGHCVDPEEGRLALDMDQLQFDPESGMPIPPPPGVRPEPKRTVYVFQPRELPGAVITTPTEVRVHSFRPADEGDTAKLEIFGAPPAQPLPIAPNGPKLGQAVTSIGFPDANIAETDGVDLEALLTGAKSPAEVLQDSRLQPSNTSGTITARQFREGVAVHQINADVDFGTSGGPTINSRGEVLGINSMMTISFAGNFNIITDTGMLREFLGHDQPQPDQPQPAPPPTAASTVAPSTAPAPRISGNTAVQGSLPPGWLLPIPILGAVILGAGLIWLLTRRNASVSGTPTEEATPSLGKHAHASD